ncbi:GNAT family N-acetyltransferase [Thaumasiovibrio subtropicus]|uniref:GNAT family N-acetyltransferase n=1 Tax=Thaumasiovibrio subtropicus TaxID=1891207 RepID=UPI000B34D713|nr:GNAT family N-acetyltransferase [Thaumasiovibrio subtropicus]
MAAIYLSELSLSDKESVFALLKDPEVMRYLGPRRPLTDAEAQQWFDDALNNPSRLVFREASTNDLIGFCGIKMLGGKADFGYFLLRQFWGKGYATRMCEMTIEALANRTDFSTVEVFIAEHNLASIRLANRLGWRRIKASKNAFESGYLYLIDNTRAIRYEI